MISGPAKKCLFVLGMHRSGTSAVTGSLQLLDLPLGQDLMEPNEYNVKGYFENNKIYAFNDALLAHLGVSWNLTYLLEHNWWLASDLTPFKVRLQEILKEDFSEESLFVVKDPRISVLLPFWKQVVHAMGIEDHYLIMLRHPDEIQQSLSRREGFAAPKSHLLWADHIFKAEHFTRDRKRIVLMFNDFLQAPLQELQWIDEQLELGFADQLSESQDVMEFVDPNLRHHSFESTLLRPEFKALWDLCEKASHSAVKNQVVQGMFDELHERHNALVQQFIIPIWQDARDLVSKTLHSVETSSREPFISLLDTIRQAQSESLERNAQLIDERNGELRRIQMDLSLLKSEKDKLQVLHSQASEDLKRYRSEVLQLKAKNFIQAEDIRDARTALDEQKKAVRAYEGKVSSLKEDYEEQRREIVGLREKDAKQRDQLKQGEDTIESLRNEVHIQKVSSIYHERARENVLHDLKALRASWTYRIGRFLTMPGHWAFRYRTVRSLLSVSAWTFYMLRYVLTNPRKVFKHIQEGQLKKVLKSLRYPESYQVSSEKVIDNYANVKTSSPRTSTLEIPSKKLQVLFVSPNLPDYDASSGGKRATEMLRLLAEEYDVYVYSPSAGEDKYVRKLLSIGARVLAVDAVEEIPTRVPHFDSIIFAWYYVFYNCRQLLELYPNARIIADTVDVHWIREERSLGERQGLTAETVMSNKKREIAVYRKADIIWTVTEPDKEAVLKEIPDADIRVVSNIHSIEKSHFVPASEKSVLFFGGYQHYPNIKAVRTLATKIFPNIRAAVPNAKLLIAGSKAPDEIKQLGNLAGVEYIGFVEDSDVSDLYDRAALTIVPLFSGAGIKGKICEAIAHRLPVITNQVGNEGIGLEHESEALLAEEPQEMADFAIGVLKNEYPLELMTSKAQHRLMPIVGPSAVKASMVASISPGIAICIVTWNRKELLQLCLESILKNTVYPNFKVLVHSNACTDDTRRYLQEVSRQDDRIEPIISDKNEVFVLPNNNMMQLYPEYDVVLLNNDTTVAPGWLTALYRAAYLSSDIGVAGSKVLYPDGTLQEFGSELYEDGTGRNIGKGDSPDNERYQLPKYVGYVSGCAMYIKRSTIGRIGVFDERFHPCYCEDSDYCYSAWEQGLKTIVTPHSIVYHHEGATSGTDTSSGFKAYQGINMKKFLTKHKDQLARINGEISTLVAQKEDFLSRVNNSARKKYEDAFGKDILAGTQCVIDNRIADYEAFTRYREKMMPVYKRREQIENRLYQDNLLDFDLHGYNPMICREVTYRIHMPKLNGSDIISLKPNYRETVICPETKTNSRMRALAIQLNRVLEDYGKDAVLYFTEHRTPFYNYYQKRLENLYGSEYLGSGFKSGKLYNGFRHEKLHDLSFGDHQFEIIVSLDALQYVPDYGRALAEFFRCLKPGGSILMTVPFDLNQEQHLVRSSIDVRGVVKHRETPLYYSNHIHKEQDLLCYHHFGWELLDRMREVGFSAVNIHFGWDLYQGVLGRDMHWIMGKKE